MGSVAEISNTTAEQVNKELASLSREEVLRVISSMEDDMAAASREMDFERAATLRNQVVQLKAQFEGSSEDDVLKELKRSARKGSAFGNRKNAAYGSSRRSGLRGAAVGRCAPCRSVADDRRLSSAISCWWRAVRQRRADSACVGGRRIPFLTARRCRARW